MSNRKYPGLTNTQHGLLSGRAPDHYRYYANRGRSDIESSLRQTPGGFIAIGTVTRSDAEHYCCEVGIPGLKMGDFSCTPSAPAMGNVFGSAYASLPEEGAIVLVYVPDPGVKSGIIIGCCPRTAVLGQDIGKSGIGDYVDILNADGTAAAKQASAYERPEKTKGSVFHRSTYGRPADLYPGEHAVLSRTGIGLMVLRAMASLKASERARIDVSNLDDIVRIVSGYFMHLSASGERQVYDDGGFISDIREFASYREELAPKPEEGEAGEEDENGAGEPKALAPKYRASSYAGALGDFYHAFVHGQQDDVDYGDLLSSPDATTRLLGFLAMLKGEKPPVQGLGGLHVDSSGAVALKTAAGGVLQLTDKIPVPERRRRPWDPEGDKLEDDGFEPEAKEHYEYDDEHNGGRHLEFRDALMWENRQTYLRFMNQEKDYYLPEEADLEPLRDEYDRPGKAEMDYASNKDRRAWIGVLPDGTVLMRSSGGASLSLSSDGNIYVDCPGRIEVKPGGDFVAVVGGTLAMRAREHAEVVAQSGDVRIRAAKTAFVSAKTDVVMEGDESVVLRSEQGTVYSRAPVVHLSASSAMLLDGKNSKDDAAAAPLIAAFRDCRVSTEEGALIMAGDGSGVFVLDAGVQVVGGSVNVLAERSLALVADRKVWLPAAQVELASDPRQQMADIIEELYENYQEDDLWMQRFGVGVVDAEQYVFHYSTVDEYRTAGVKVYEQVWAPMKRTGHFMLKDFSEKDWPDRDPIEARRAEDGRKLPWPGFGVWDGALAELNKEVNFSDVSKEVAAKRRTMVGKSQGFSEKSLDEMKALEPNS